MTETWKPILDLPGYEVSDCGNVRSWFNTHGQIVDRPHPLKQMLTYKGRPTIRIRRRDRQCTLYIHRLVLEAFVGPCPEGMQACHYDDDSLNNHVDNLRWDTRAANVLDKLRNGKVPRGEASGAAKLTRKQVLEIRDRYAAGEYSGPLAKEFGVTVTSIRAISSGRAWKHLGGPITFDGRQGNPRRIASDQIPTILARRRAGETYASIALDFGVSNVTIRNYVMRHS